VEAGLQESRWVIARQRDLTLPGAGSNPVTIPRRSWVRIWLVGITLPVGNDVPTRRATSICLSRGQIQLSGSVEIHEVGRQTEQGGGLLAEVMRSRGLSLS